MDSAKELVEKIEKFYDILIKASSGRYDTLAFRAARDEYTSLRTYLLSNSEFRPRIPKFIVTCPTLDDLSDYMKAKGLSYESRRSLLKGEFETAFAFIYGLTDESTEHPEANSGKSIASQYAPKPQIFIIHGHDSTSLGRLRYVLHKIGANPITFEDIPKQGSPTIIEILEECISKFDAVIALFTPDDEGRERGDERLDLRARENVLIEAGYSLISKREKSFIIALGNVSTPSDFGGIHHIPASAWSTETEMLVAKRLKDMGLKVEPFTHCLNLEIPSGWKIVKDTFEGNDTQVLLTDGTNTIRIDLIKHSGINKLIGDYLVHHVSKADLDKHACNPNDPTTYPRCPWYSNDAICNYYMENVITPIALVGNNYHGWGISVKPDGVKYAGYYTNEYSPQHPGHSVDVYEWIIAWTKPNYDNEIIGVHSSFKGEFHEIKLEMSGSNVEYHMPEPLWTVLTTLNREFKPSLKATTYPILS